MQRGANVGANAGFQRVPGLVAENGEHIRDRGSTGAFRLLGLFEGVHGGGVLDFTGWRLRHCNDLADCSTTKMARHTGFLLPLSFCWDNDGIIVGVRSGIVVV